LERVKSLQVIEPFAVTFFFIGKISLLHNPIGFTRNFP
jgi:hypothetical protein